MARKWLLYTMVLLSINELTGQSQSRSEPDQSKSSSSKSQLKKAVSSKQTDEERLLSTLMSSYNRASRPVYNSSHTVTVHLDLDIRKILELDEKRQQLTVIAWQNMRWADERLRWDTTDYNNLFKIAIPSDLLWVPDVDVINYVADESKGTSMKNAMATIDKYGEINYARIVKLIAPVQMNYTCYPFDSQECLIKFASFNYNGLQVDLLNSRDEVNLTEYEPNGEWHLIQVKVVRNVLLYSCCIEPFPDVRYTILMSRRTLFQSTYLIFPSILLTILNVAAFALPPETGERVTTGSIVFLSFAVFMLLLSDKVPPASTATPLLNKYLMAAISLNFATVVLAIIMQNVFHYALPPRNSVQPISQLQASSNTAAQVAGAYALAPTSQPVEQSSTINLYAAAPAPPQQTTYVLSTDYARNINRRDKHDYGSVKWLKVALHVTDKCCLLALVGVTLFIDLYYFTVPLAGCERKFV